MPGYPTRTEKPHFFAEKNLQTLFYQISEFYSKSVRPVILSLVPLQINLSPHRVGLLRY